MAGTLEIGQIDLISSDGLSTSVIKTENSGACSINKGLRLPNTVSNDTMALDWYEEGTFIPAIIGATTPGVGTYTSQLGKYTRIGNRVDIQVAISITNHTGTGTIKISGLPFTSSSTVGFESTAIADVSNLTATGTVMLILPANSLSIFLSQSNNGVSTNINMDTAFSISFNMTYFV